MAASAVIGTDCVDASIKTAAFVADKVEELRLGGGDSLRCVAFGFDCGSEMARDKRRSIGRQPERPVFNRDG